jgi:transcriptional regulator with XRE-family HTH domain
MLKFQDPIEVLLAANVRQLRIDAGLTQAELSVGVGIFRTYLSRIESGKANPTLSVIALLANRLNVTPSELLKG